MEAAIVLAVLFALILIADRFGAEATSVEKCPEYCQALTGAIREPLPSHSAMPSIQVEPPAATGPLAVRPLATHPALSEAT